LGDDFILPSHGFACVKKCIFYDEESAPQQTGLRSTPALMERLPGAAAPLKSHQRGQAPAKPAVLRDIPPHFETNAERQP